jgi:hypothetical protein
MRQAIFAGAAGRLVASSQPPRRSHMCEAYQPHTFGQLATLAYDPMQPRYVRRWHRAALETSLVQLATLVRSVAALSA